MLVHPSGSFDSTWGGEFGGVESAVLWHDESGAEIGGRHATFGRRSSNRFARAARGAGTVGSDPFDTAAVSAARPHHPACARGCRCAQKCAGTRSLAEDGTVLAQAVAPGGRWTVRLRAAGRCAALGCTTDVHARANLRGGCDDMREAVGERAAHQPMEPARDCRRGHAPRPRAGHFAALGGAFLKKRQTSNPIWSKNRNGGSDSVASLLKRLSWDNG